MAQRQPQCDWFFDGLGSSDAPISRSRDSNSRHLDQQLLLPQAAAHNPYVDALASSFSRLGVSRHGQSGFGGDVFVGSNPDYGFDCGVLDFLPHSIEETGRGPPDVDINSSVLVGSRDYAHYSMLSQLEIGSWDRLNFDSFPTHEVDEPVLDLNGFLHMDSTGYLRQHGLDHFANLNCLRSSMYNLSWENLRGSTLEMAKDERRCRLLQDAIARMKREEIGMVFGEMIGQVGELILHPSGNYAVQKLVEVCSEEQITQILQMLTKTEYKLVSVCLNVHGTRAIQKLLDHVRTRQQISIIMSALIPGAVALTKDMNGHHVIQHCLKHFSEEDNKYFLNVVADNCFRIATDKCGCCVLQHCVEYSQGETRDRLVAEIIGNALLLSEDPYGNYVVQHIMGLRVPQITRNLLTRLEGSYVELSCNKYGSNVVEKCLLESSEEQSTRIIIELISSANASLLLMDPYANFVIQSALKVSKGIVREALVELVRVNSPMMRSNIYGKKVLGWFYKNKLQHMLACTGLSAVF